MRTALIHARDMREETVARTARMVGALGPPRSERVARAPANGSPTMTRPRNPDLYDVPLLTFS
ncbi:hypothetical protein GCM10018980_71810 [Streptomyces capoamus]|uniref:Uncharacterized protein n=1 Tax=Streptomyces capoamus TaxID=68183 RepID=A0A919F310_9ACTN|nr:hypothetical protein GCM10010501_16450 [Streptomyces libani subsp. rufus]GHG74750.1 hypothetical protein GCM10018980_71810 [Streptomyces capoamus]